MMTRAPSVAPAIIPTLSLLLVAAMGTTAEGVKRPVDVIVDCVETVVRVLPTLPSESVTLTSNSVVVSTIVVKTLSVGVPRLIDEPLGMLASGPGLTPRTTGARMVDRGGASVARRVG